MKEGAPSFPVSFHLSRLMPHPPLAAFRDRDFLKKMALSRMLFSYPSDPPRPPPLFPPLAHPAVYDDPPVSIQFTFSRFPLCPPPALFCIVSTCTPRAAFIGSRCDDPDFFFSLRFHTVSPLHSQLLSRQIPATREVGHGKDV